MADRWDDEENPTTVRDTWEDEEAEVKDAWDEEEPEVPKPVKKPEATKPAKKPVKDFKEMTEEEKKAAQEAADMFSAKELFGLDKSLSDLKLTSKEDVKPCVDILYATLNPMNKNPHYFELLDELFKSLAQQLPSDSIKKLWSSLKTIGDQKQAEEKATKPKEAQKKPKIKAPKIKLESDRIKGDFDVYQDANRGGYDDDDDDFM